MGCVATCRTQARRSTPMPPSLRPPRPRRRPLASAQARPTRRPPAAPVTDSAAAPWIPAGGAAAPRCFRWLRSPSSECRQSPQLAPPPPPPLPGRCLQSPSSEPRCLSPPPLSPPLWLHPQPTLASRRGRSVRVIVCGTHPRHRRWSTSPRRWSCTVSCSLRYSTPMRRWPRQSDGTSCPRNPPPAAQKPRHPAALFSSTSSSSSSLSLSSWDKFLYFLYVSGRRRRQGRRQRRHRRWRRLG
mmetsp:Transcript_10558/g.25872  ORF Transcript_10558/g.25872 Transcript_10558/m.25872 type:complete len:242 (+) Transcript_10558:191-916(+)